MAPARGGPVRAATPCTAVIRPNAGGRRLRPKTLTNRGDVAEIQRPVRRPNAHEKIRKKRYAPTEGSMSGGIAAENIANKVKTIGSHQVLSQSHPDMIRPTELLIPAAEIRNAAFSELTPDTVARLGK